MKSGQFYRWRTSLKVGDAIANMNKALETILLLEVRDHFCLSIPFARWLRPIKPSKATSERKHKRNRRNRLTDSQMLSKDTNNITRRINLITKVFLASNKNYLIHTLIQLKSNQQQQQWCL